jgi:nucleosome-remodeling factor subunit BPTF
MTTFFLPGSLKHLKVFPPISKFEEIDITKALTSCGRLQYPKIAKKSRLDEFLTRRTHLKLLEERRFSQSVCSLKIACFNVQGDTETLMCL